DETGHTQLKALRHPSEQSGHCQTDSLKVQSSPVAIKPFQINPCVLPRLRPSREPRAKTSARPESSPPIFPTSAGFWMRRTDDRSRLTLTPARINNGYTSQRRSGQTKPPIPRFVPHVWVVPGVDTATG